MAIYRLINKIRNYEWGSADLMAGYFGIHIKGKGPMAEMWMGAHPGASSAVVLSGKETGLVKAIEENPQHFLGRRVSEKFGGKLPFLFKVLSAGRPLSVQAHPDKLQAVSGFMLENKAGIPIDDPKRNYRDDNHKPEIICAVSEFHALRGFRSPEDIIKYLLSLNNKLLEGICRKLEKENGYRGFFKSLMTFRMEEKKSILADAGKWSSDKNSPEKEWVSRLLEYYPDDISAISPLYLNLIKLDPGEAMYLDAGELHSYLQGIGIELMANSDNVLRGGLTVKNIDFKELDNILKYSACIPEILTCEKGRDILFSYNTPADEFRLSVIFTDNYVDINDCAGPRIIICQRGKIRIIQGKNVSVINSGESVYITPSKENIRIMGKGILYAADIPL